jgi:acyl-homoserine-lactone acylase
MKDAIAYLQGKGIAFDAPLSKLQVADKVGAEIPVGGGSGTVGNANVVVARGPFSTANGLYRVTYGSSHIQAVSFTSTGVKASTILTYGQSLNINSAWSSDQTKLFGNEQWVSFPFTSTQIAAQKISSKHLVVTR